MFDASDLFVVLRQGACAGRRYTGVPGFRG